MLLEHEARDPLGLHNAPCGTCQLAHTAKMMIEDIQPVIANQDGLEVVDARIILHAENTSD